MFYVHFVLLLDCDHFVIFILVLANFLYFSPFYAFIVVNWPELDGFKRQSNGNK